MRKIMWASLLAACQPGASDLEPEIDALRALVSDHAAQVTFATTVDEVVGLEVSYQAEADALLFDMNDRLDQRHGGTMCITCGGRRGAQAVTALEELEEELVTHMSEHQLHVDVPACAEEERFHENDMDAYLHDVLDAEGGCSAHPL